MNCILAYLAKYGLILCKVYIIIRAANLYYLYMIHSYSKFNKINKWFIIR